MKDSLMWKNICHVICDKLLLYKEFLQNKQKATMKKETGRNRMYSQESMSKWPMSIKWWLNYTHNDPVISLVFIQLIKMSTYIHPKIHTHDKSNMSHKILNSRQHKCSFVLK